MKKQSDDVKICIYIGGFDMPEKNAAANAVRIYGKLIENLGYKIVYVGISHDIPYKSNIISTKTMIEENEYYAIGYPNGFAEWIEYTVEKKKYIDVIEKYKNVNAIILYNLNAIPLDGIRRYCKKRNIMCIANTTEWYSSKGRGLIWGAFRGLDTWLRMEYVQKRFKKVVAVSRYLEKEYADDERRKTVRVPVLFDSEELRWKNKKTKPNEKLHIVYSGSLGNKECLDVIIEAIKQVKRPVHFDVIGLSIDDYFKANGEDEWVKNNEDIVFHGRISREEAIEFTKEANYTCFIRNNCRVTNAGFPSKLTESLACNTPIITNDTGDVSLYIRNGQNGYLLPSEPNVESLREVIENARLDMKVDGTMLDYRNYLDAFKYILEE